MDTQNFQEVISSVLSSIRTNSRTIEQLTPVTTLGDTDFFEISGGKKVSYQVLKTLIKNFFGDDFEQKLADLSKRIIAEEEARESGEEYLQEYMNNLRETLEVAVSTNLAQTRQIEQLYETVSDVTVESIKHESRISALEGMWVKVDSEEAAETMADEGMMEKGKFYYTVEEE